jgi:hypothetical protein
LVWEDFRSFYSLNANVSHGTKVLEIQTLLGEEKYPVPLPFKTLQNLAF